MSKEPESGPDNIPTGREDPTSGTSIVPKRSTKRKTRRISCVFPNCTKVAVGSRFLTIEALISHIKQLHSQDVEWNLYQCRNCKYIFNSRGQLKNHWSASSVDDQGNYVGDNVCPYPQIRASHEENELAARRQDAREIIERKPIDERAAWGRINSLCMKLPRPSNTHRNRNIYAPNGLVIGSELFKAVEWVGRLPVPESLKHAGQHGRALGLLQKVTYETSGKLNHVWRLTFKVPESLALKDSTDIMLLIPRDKGFSHALTLNLRQSNHEVRRIFNLGPYRALAPRVVPRILLSSSDIKDIQELQFTMEACAEGAPISRLWGSLSLEKRGNFVKDLATVLARLHTSRYDAITSFASKTYLESTHNRLRGAPIAQEMAVGTEASSSGPLCALMLTLLPAIQRLSLHGNWMQDPARTYDEKHGISEHVQYYAEKAYAAVVNIHPPSETDFPSLFAQRQKLLESLEQLKQELRTAEQQTEHLVLTHGNLTSDKVYVNPDDGTICCVIGWDLASTAPITSVLDTQKIIVDRNGALLFDQQWTEEFMKEFRAKTQERVCKEPGRHRVPPSDMAQIELPTNPLFGRLWTHLRELAALRQALTEVGAESI